MSQSNKVAAIKYDSKNNNAPIVVASGSGYVADKIIGIAEGSGVPIYKDDSVATILSQLDVGQEVPKELFSALVDIYVYFLDFNNSDK